MDRQIDKPDHTAVLFAFALFLTASSYLFLLASVHKYCENRAIGVGLALASAAVLYLLFRCWPSASWRRAIAVLATFCCLVVFVFNTCFFVWATKTCVAQQRLPVE